MNHLAPDPAGVRLGPFWLSPGITRGNALTLLFGAVSTLCLVTFVTFAQPYLFAIVGIPQSEQGVLSGILLSAQEGTQVLIAGLIGALSDRTGRRVVYVAGLICMALSFIIYPLAGSGTELIAYRVVLAVGMTAATVMMSTCFAEYSQDVSRGRWMGTVGVFNGLGVVLMATVLAKLPLWLSGQGLDDVTAIRYSFWIFGGYILLLALILRAGLQGHTPSSGRAKRTLLQQTTIGIAAARDNPRIALAYVLAFASRGDLVIITTFISLWVIQAGIDAGLTLGAATAKAGMIFGIAQGVALIWSFVMGYILDRIPRLTGVCLAFVLAGLGYSALGQVDDPFGAWMLPAAILAGLGEASAVVAAGVLIGQEAPASIRGTVIGTFGLCGSLGIICLTFAGGQVFDAFGRNAPFAMMGIVNLAVVGMALWVRNRSSSEQRIIESAAGSLRNAD
ncbi:MAG: MFS transporter [Gammaproteobacteria bacterium]|nr:MFS transporter [Gammaproteobacteria bacterium]